MKLDNAEERAKAHADFEIPPRALREDLMVGDSAKLVFLADKPHRVEIRGEVHHPKSERMWVRVTARKDGRYEGDLANTPLFLPFAIGDKVSFGPEHIIDVKRLAS